MILIGLTGPARSGKDSTGEVLQRRGGFYRYAITKPLKAMLECLGVGLDDWSDAKKELDIPWLGAGVSPRYLAQTLGTEWGRNLVHRDLWLLLAQRWTETLAPDERVVVTDVRFDNEADWIRESGGELWHIQRTDRTEVLKHSSENGVRRFDCDRVVSNNGTLEELDLRVCEILVEKSL